MNKKDQDYIESLKEDGVAYVGYPAPIAVGFRYHDGDKVWVTREYGEDTTPERAVIVGETRVASDKKDVYGVRLSFDNNDESTLMCGMRIFYIKTNAVKYSQLLVDMRELQLTDETHQITERILATPMEDRV